MISTVTTTTVTTVTSAAFAASIGLVTIVLLLILLVQKELVLGAIDARTRILGRLLNVAIMPLLLAFVFIVVTKVVGVMR